MLSSIDLAWAEDEEEACVVLSAVSLQPLLDGMARTVAGRRQGLENLLGARDCICGLGPNYAGGHTEDDLFGFGAKERGRAACFAGVLGIGFGIFGCTFCLALGMKRSLPPDMLALLSVEGWQFSVAINFHEQTGALT